MPNAISKAQKALKEQVSVQDDIDFEQAMRDVRRLNSKSPAPLQKRRTGNAQIRAEIQQRARQSAATLVETPSSDAADFAGKSNEAGDEHLYFLGQGLQKKILRELKQGRRYPVADSLDLHGLTQQQAEQQLAQMLDEFSTARGCLLIVHGKGLRSAEGPVLKNLTARYLKSHPRVRAFCSASISDGGTGALYVLLRD